MSSSITSWVRRVGYPKIKILKTNLSAVDQYTLSRGANENAPASWPAEVGDVYPEPYSGNNAICSSVDIEADSSGNYWIATVNYSTDSGGGFEANRNDGESSYELRSAGNLVPIQHHPKFKMFWRYDLIRTTGNQDLPAGAFVDVNFEQRNDWTEDQQKNWAWTDSTTYPDGWELYSSRSKFAEEYYRNSISILEKKFYTREEDIKDIANRVGTVVTPAKTFGFDPTPASGDNPAGGWILTGCDVYKYNNRRWCAQLTYIWADKIEPEIYD